MYTVLSQCLHQALVKVQGDLTRSYKNASVTMQTQNTAVDQLQASLISKTQTSKTQVMERKFHNQM